MSNNGMIVLFLFIFIAYLAATGRLSKVITVLGS